MRSDSSSYNNKSYSHPSSDDTILSLDNIDFVNIHAKRNSYDNDEQNSVSRNFDKNNGDNDRLLLLDTKRKWKKHSSDIIDRNTTNWMKPYWLGFGLYLILFSFWLLDSLKEAILSNLVPGGDIQQHLPIAKLVSVGTILLLVCFLEYLSSNNSHQRQQQKHTDDDDVLSGGGKWEKMKIIDSGTCNDKIQQQQQQEDFPVSASLFLYIGTSFSLVFIFIAYTLEFNASYKNNNKNDELLMSDNTPKTTTTMSFSPSSTLLAYFVFAMIESFGSLMVATFWSYTNSTLSLTEAEGCYGTIIAIGQLGAICGSTMVARGKLPTKSILIVAALIILLVVLVMTSYDRQFFSLSSLKRNDDNKTTTVNTTIRQQQQKSKLLSFCCSGVRLILQYKYVLYILGVSCLYEINLTTLDYQMKLLGYIRAIDQNEFTQFVGRFGQFTNMTSLVLSSVVFPLLIKRFGLRYTLRIFPSFLLIVTLITFYSPVQDNHRLSVLFVSMSLLKAMTYSIHDPSKEMLYIPTTNRIKFQSKFWIDVVGARLAKAIGSGINKVAGSVDRSILLGRIPNFLSAVALLAVCWRAGGMFDMLVVQKGITPGVKRRSSNNIHNLIPPSLEEQNEYHRVNAVESEDKEYINDGEDVYCVEEEGNVAEDRREQELITI